MDSKPANQSVWGSSLGCVHSYRTFVHRSQSLKNVFLLTGPSGADIRPRFRWQGYKVPLGPWRYRDERLALLSDQCMPQGDLSRSYLWVQLVLSATFVYLSCWNHLEPWGCVQCPVKKPSEGSRMKWAKPEGSESLWTTGNKGPQGQVGNFRNKASSDAPWKEEWVPLSQGC